MAVRQRRPLVVPEEASHPLFERPVFKKFSKLDIYARPAAETQRKTVLGGAVSVAALLIITLLIMWELCHYVAGTEAYHDRLAVDTGISAKVPLTFNITFPAVQCQDLHLDVMDASGAHEADVQTDLYKAPVDRGGRLAFRGPSRSIPFTRHGQEVELPPEDNLGSPAYCGKCYIEPMGKRYWLERLAKSVMQRHLATQHSGECCNSCDEVMAVYDRHRLPRPDPEDVEQCLHHLFMVHPGCNVRGVLHLKKVKGNFHFAPGRAVDGHPHAPAGLHMHSFDPQAVMRFNPSHHILHFSFGDPAVHRFSRRGVTHPLDDTHFHTPPNKLATVKYLITAVPTAYQTGGGRLEKSFEMAVHSHSRLYPERFLPTNVGVYFFYDFSPIKITHQFRRPPLLHFLVKLAGLVGGLFVVTSMLEAALTAAAALHARLTAPPAPQTL